MIEVLGWWIKLKTSLCSIVWLGNSTPKESLWPEKVNMSSRVGNFLCEIKVIGNWRYQLLEMSPSFCRRCSVYVLSNWFNWFLHNLTLIWLVFGSFEGGRFKALVLVCTRCGLNSKLKYSQIFGLFQACPCVVTLTHNMYKGHKSEGCFNSYLKFLRQQLKSQGAPSDCPKDRRKFRKGTQLNK